MNVIDGHKEQAPTSQESAEEIATQHVEWFLKIIKPLLIDHMIHGFKHGQEFEQELERSRREELPR